MKYIIIAACLLASACSDTSTISTSLVPVGSNSYVGNDILAARFNLEKAVAIGAIQADDPALGCLNGVLADLGEGTVGSFTPERSGLISEGAIIYIRAQQVKKLQQFQQPAACDAIVGRLMIDAAKIGLRTFPGAGALVR